MIIVLEGNNGSGKSAIAAALKTRRGLHRIRPWADVKEAWKRGDYEDAQALAKYGIQINSLAEDLALADMVVNAELPTIMDRSLPSVLAYESDTRWEALGIWERLLARSMMPRYYIWLDVDYDTAMKRTADREVGWGDKMDRARFADIRAGFLRAYTSLSPRQWTKRIHIRTQEMDQAAVLAQVMEEVP